MTRSNYYYNDRGLKIRCEGADGGIVFKSIEGVGSLERNSRDQRCIEYDAKEIMRLPNDMSLVIYDETEGIILFLEKWKLYFIDPVNIIINKRDITLMVPYKTFTNIGGFPWIDTHASNVTWAAIKEDIKLAPVPDDLEDQINLYEYAIKEKKSS